MSNEWCLIESDPAVFTELLEKIGVRGVSAEEVLSLDVSELQPYARVYGLILLFKWKPHTDVPLPGTLVTDDEEDANNSNNNNNNANNNTSVYFARQVVHNACATLALVNILCNYTDDMALGEDMQHFATFTRALDATTRGQQVGDYAPLRNAHNSFAPPPAMAEDESATPSADAQAYHYVAFIVRHGAVWMLDGLQRGPVRCANVDDNSNDDNNNNNSNNNNNDNHDKDKAAMLRVARAYIDAHVARDTSGSGQGISFSLMAIVDDPIVVLERAMATREGNAAAAAAASPSSDELARELATWREARARGRAENARRRHNYYPMLVALLGALAEKQLLEPIVDEVKAAKTRSSAGGGGKTSAKAA